MIDAYATACASGWARAGYDIVHAQDCISAHAALTLRDDGADPARAAHRPPRRRLHARRRSWPASAARSSRPDAVLCVPRPGSTRVRGRVRRRGPAWCATASTPSATGPPATPPSAPPLRAALGSRRPPRRAGHRRHRAPQGVARAARGLRAPAPRAARARPAAGRGRRRDAVRPPRRDRALRTPRARSSGLDDRFVRVLGPVADERARAPLPRRRRLRLPLRSRGLRARGARGLASGAAGGRHRPRRPARRRRARAQRAAWRRPATPTRSGASSAAPPSDRRPARPAARRRARGGRRATAGTPRPRAHERAYADLLARTAAVPA